MGNLVQQEDEEGEKKVHVLTLHLKMTSQPHIDGVSPLRTVLPKKKA